LREVLESEEAFTICRHSLLSADNSAYEDIFGKSFPEFALRIWPKE
jgi:hypothetical protein